MEDTSMNVALLFPGQGAQYPGFLHALPANAAVEVTLQEASDQLQQDALTLDSEEALRSTVAAQMALMIAGVAFLRYCVANEIQPKAVAGMSVGAYAAAVAAGAIDFPSALAMVRRRAESMEDAFAPGTHGMAVVEGLRISALAQRIAGTDIVLANHNAVTQMVLAGPLDALESMLPRCVEDGATTARLLPIAVASHTPMLLPAADELLKFAQELPFVTPRILMYSNRTARPLTTADAVRHELAFNMAHPVRWYDTVTALGGIGMELFLEAPPGHALSGLTAETLPDIRSLAADDMRWDVLLRATQRGG